MTEQHRDLLGILLSISVVALSIFIVHRFIPSLLWGGIISMSTFPLYERWLVLCRHNDAFAATSFTGLVTLLLVIPITWFVTILVQESHIVVNYFMHINNHGAPVPDIIKELPLIGDDLTRLWQKHFSHSGGFKTFFKSSQISLTPVSFYAKEIGTSLFRRGVQFGFTILCMFFFYRDGRKLISQIDRVGTASLGERWAGFAYKLPQTLQATVNGTILVGLGVGLLMGFCYKLLQFPAPALAGFATSVAAMIPFAVPFVFIIVAIVLWLSGSVLNALIILIIGTVVMFVADHFVKPVLIGNTTKLHFLAVLFGILGGVETLGLIGLFLGPMVMVLFTTLWFEAQ